MNWRFWRWMRTADLAVSQNIEDRRRDKPRTYRQIWTAWWYGPKEVVPVVTDPASKIATDLGLNSLTKEK